MPKKPQHLSIASGNVNSNNFSNNTSNKPKYSLTLHNNKYATNGGKQLIPMRDNHQQRQHLKALRLTRDVAATDATDYKRPMTTGLSPADDVGVHISRKTGCGAAAANGEASSIDLTTTTQTTKLTGNTTNGNVNGNGNAAATPMATPMANGVVRTQNNRLWYH